MQISLKYDEYTYDYQSAIIARKDNDANVLCLGHKNNISTLKEIIDNFIETPFSNEERHIRRVEKIGMLEKWN